MSVSRSGRMSLGVWVGVNECVNVIKMFCFTHLIKIGW